MNLSGAGGRIRTPDLLITNQLLYRLSYTSESCPTAGFILADIFKFVNIFCHLFYYFKEAQILRDPHSPFNPLNILRCTLCGHEIACGEEYWACNGSLVCVGCLPELARQELAPCHETHGKERFP